MRTYSEVTEDGYTYDEVETVNENGETITVRTDKRGNVRSRAYSDGSRLEYTYNASKRDRLLGVQEKQANVTVRTFAYTYDEVGNLLTYTEKEGTEVEQRETYTYNEFNQVIRVTQTAGVTYAYTYKDDSTRALENINVNNDINIKPKLDDLGRNKGRDIYIGTDKIAEEQIV